MSKEWETYRGRLRRRPVRYQHAGPSRPAPRTTSTAAGTTTSATTAPVVTFSADEAAPETETAAAADDLSALTYRELQARAIALGINGRQTRDELEAAVEDAEAQR